jgi:uncharacterized protein (TIGR03086 family)
MAGVDMGALYDRALRQAGQVIAGLSPEQLRQPTPCARWDVHTVVNHLIGGNYMFAEIAAGRRVDMSPPYPDLVGEDPAASYEASRRAAVRSVGEDGALQRLWALPFAELPGAVGRDVHLLELVAHTWDVATATGQEEELDAELADAAHGVAMMAVPPEIRNDEGDPFAHEVRAPADAAAYQRLAAYLGRSIP